MSILLSHPARKLFWPPWSGRSRPKVSSTTDDILPSANTDCSLFPLERHSTDPVGYYSALKSYPDPVVTSSIFPGLSPSILGHAEMSERATIIFVQEGVQSPVYVVTSLSTPPWQLLEMAASDLKTELGDHVFYRQFDGVAPGSYQYKIRIGENHWVVDQYKETATDEQGNCNNVVHTDPILDDVEVGSALSITEEEAARWGIALPVQAKSISGSCDQAEQEQEQRAVKDTRQDSVQLPSAPIPFAVVDKAENQGQSGSDYVESGAYEEQATPLSPHEHIGPDNARQGSQPKMHFGPSSEQEQVTPLFSHELSRPGNSRRSSLSAPAMDTIEEESARSSTEHASSEADGLIHSGSGNSTDGDHDSDDRSDELGNAPLLSHETDFSASRFEDELYKEGGDELSNGPLLTRETVFSSEAMVSREDKSELDKALLPSHEAGLSIAEDDKNHRYSSGLNDPKSRAVDSKNASAHPHEELGGGNTLDDFNGYNDDAVPLLSHERPRALSEYSGSEKAGSETGLPTFVYENTSVSPNFFGRRTTSNLFKRRAYSSSLPHRLPPSDEEDENLLDPSLEPFPVNRDQILERVATISTHLPEDDAVGSSHDAHSPAFTVMSQACSSVDLAPIDSHVSLRLVTEDALIEDDENEDAPGAPSPILDMPSRAVVPIGDSTPNKLVTSDEVAMTVPQDKKLELPKEKRGDSNPVEPDIHINERGDGESIADRDGASEDFQRRGVVPALIATPASLLVPLLTPPHTPNREVAAKKDDSPVAKAARGIEIDSKEGFPALSDHITTHNTHSETQPPPLKSADAKNSHEIRNRRVKTSETSSIPTPLEQPPADQTGDKAGLPVTGTPPGNSVLIKGWQVIRDWLTKLWALFFRATTLVLLIALVAIAFILW